VKKKKKNHLTALHCTAPASLSFCLPFFSIQNTNKQGQDKEEKIVKESFITDALPP